MVLHNFHESLHMELLRVNHVNSLHPNNFVAAISYKLTIEETDFSRVYTMGIKNMDAMHDLKGMGISLELLQLY
jgi:hypothetical protein